MSYPTLENYNEALQNHRNCLTDPVLKAGTMAKSGLGLPLALCGGFALTYTITSGGKKYAVRCFHKKSNNLETRYKVISKQLKGLRSNYFIDFEFQEAGVRIKGNNFPVVKMAWASGKTLGEFLDKQYTNKNDLQNLILSFQKLSNFLEKEGIAHGDIQPGNVMVDNRGQSLQLIDYDGIYVDELKSLGSSEIGLRNFQHPGRTTGNVWDKQLDRFSLIVLNLSLRALHSDPNLWTITQSDENGVLFKANDFADPSQSRIFQQLLTNPQLSDEVKNFASICKSPYDKTPSLEDFLAKKNIPQTAIKISTSATYTTASYLGAYPVLDGTKYDDCQRLVGDRVEVIGQIVDVLKRTTYNNKPYVFLNFGDWRKKIVKINIWSEGLDALPYEPDESWIGKWISVVGLMEPPYYSDRYGYTHLSITITRASEINIIQEKEAKHRLTAPRAVTPEPIPQIQNSEILREIRSAITTVNNTTPIHRSSTPPQKAASTQPVQAPKKNVSPNQNILQNMQSKQSATSPMTAKPVVQRAQIGTVKPKPQQPAQPIWKVLLAVGGAILFYFICFVGIGGVGLLANANPTERPAATPIVLKTATKFATKLSPVIKPSATPTPKCVLWLDIKEAMEGQTKCFFGLIASRKNFYEENAFFYTLIRFSDNTKDFYITSHAQPILNFKTGDCISAKSKILIDKSGNLFMEVSEVSPYKCPK